MLAGESWGSKIMRSILCGDCIQTGYSLMNARCVLTHVVRGVFLSRVENFTTFDTSVIIEFY